MKNLISAALLSLLLVPGLANAKKGIGNQEVRNLIAKMKYRSESVHKRMRALSDPLIRYSVAPGPSPEQGQNVTVFATLNSGFTDSETFLADAKLDGANVALEHPSEGLWIFEAGSFTELKSHTLQSTVFIQDAAQAKAIRDAIQSLEAQIADLNNQIANATDPDVIAQLTAQRDEKQALKDSLVTALANLKSAVATEQVTFSVVPATTGTEFPKITSVEPNFGKFDQAAVITITGENFPTDTGVDLYIGGQVANSASVVSSTSISANIPAFTAPGAKDIEVRFTKDGKTKNAFFRNGYFAGSQAAEVEYPPVAVAGPNQSMTLGGSATFSGANSYDNNNHEISYSWQVISKPAGSSLVIPTSPPGTGVTFSVTPDVPGSYVISLSVSKGSPALWSQPSLTVLDVSPPANRAPTGSAPGISVSKNFAKNTQITASDADFWQSRSFFVTKQSAFGAASVSNTGLVSFQAGSNPGSDTLEVSVVDNGTPPLSSVVSIPVTVLNNAPPVIQSTPAAFQRTDGAPYQMRMGLFGIGSGAVTDPDGTIQSLVWDFGDGTHERIFDFAAASVLHNYMAPGTYTVTLTATDNNGATTSVSGQAIVRSGAVPNAKFKYNVRAGSVPLTVTFDASTASGPSGIAQYRWFIQGQAAEIVTTNPVFTWTFNTPGTYGIRLRTRETAGTSCGEGESTLSVFAGGTDPGPFPFSAPVIGPPRMVSLGTPTTFDGSNSFTAAPGHNIANYNWTFGDGANQGAGMMQSYTYPASRNYFAALQTTSDTGIVALPVPLETWAINAGAPPRAIMRIDRTSGVGPLTVNLDASESYDYDGSLSETSYFWNFGDGNTVFGQHAASHTYAPSSTPYNLSLVVTDSDGNATQVNQLVNVSAAQVETTRVPKKLDGFDDEATREYQRQVLTGACYQSNIAESCYQLGQMYAEDGQENTKNALWQKACGMGYQPACAVK